MNRAQRLAARGGDWPRTTRILPWLLAAFLVMLWLVPFDDVDVPVPMPIDSKLDRFALGALVLVWGLSLLSDEAGRPRLRHVTGVDIAIGSFLLIALTSVFVNVERIALHDELTLSVKKLALLFSFAAFFAIVSTTLRPTELRSFSVLLLALATLTALGTIWEYRTGANLFYDWTKRLAPPGFEVGSAGADPRFGRPKITGPTRHALAATAILAMALPFAVIGIMEARRRSRQLLYALAALLLFAAAVSTLRKSALFAPLAALSVLFLYRPRPMLKLLPVGLAFVFAIQLVTPGALGSIRSQLNPDRLERVGTVQDRVADYDAIKPDTAAYPMVGRGYGTYDHEKYRLLDNQYLGMRIGMGYLGLAAYLALWLSVIGVADRAIRLRDSARASTGLAAAAAAATFGVVSALFDVMAFPHVPYLLLFVAGMGVVAAVGRGGRAEQADVPERTGARAAAPQPTVAVERG